MSKFKLLCVTLIIILISLNSYADYPLSVSVPSSGLSHLPLTDLTRISPDRQRIVVQFYQEATSGVTERQFDLGLYLYHRRGSAKDNENALWWLRLAANNGNISAQRMLGMSYANGDGVARDQRAAKFWFDKCVTRDFSCRTAAMLNETGGGSVSESKAVRNDNTSIKKDKVLVSFLSSTMVDSAVVGNWLASHDDWRKINQYTTNNSIAFAYYNKAITNVDSKPIRVWRMDDYSTPINYDGKQYKSTFRLVSVTCGTPDSTTFKDIQIMAFSGNLLSGNKVGFWILKNIDYVDPAYDSIGTPYINTQLYEEFCPHGQYG